MIKHIYFFRSTLATHVDIYLSWVDLVNKEFNSEIITFVSFPTFVKQYKLVKLYRSKGVTVCILPGFIQEIIFVGYLVLISARYSKVVIHLKKRKSRLMSVYKSINTKIKVIIDYEGDPASELVYLSRDKCSINDYRDNITGLALQTKFQAAEVADADAVVVTTGALKQEYVKRFNTQKIHFIPTGYNVKNFYPDAKLRETVRNKLGLNEKNVLVYSGNLFYSWQNIAQTLQLFKLLYEKNSSNFLLLLVRAQDEGIAKHFAKKYAVDSKYYLIFSVNNDEMNSYLNAADIGILLRQDEALNRYAAPGKMGEYLSSGLKIISTPYVGFYSDKLIDQNFFFSVDLNNLDGEISNLDNFVSRECDRADIHSWARENVSNKLFSDDYNLLIKEI